MADPRRREGGSGKKDRGARVETEVVEGRVGVCRQWRRRQESIARSLVGAMLGAGTGAGWCWLVLAGAGGGDGRRR